MTDADKALKDYLATGKGFYGATPTATAYDAFKKGVEFAAVMPQQAALTLTDDVLEAGRQAWLEAMDKHIGKPIISVAESRACFAEAYKAMTALLSQASQPAVPAMPVAWIDSLAMTVARLEEDAEMFDQCGQNSTAEDRRARAYEITQMIAAAPKVDAAVPADQGAREQRGQNSDFDTYRAFWQKHALGSLERPSCLMCGCNEHAPSIKHAELADIYICEQCVAKNRAAAPSQGAQESRACAGGSAAGGAPRAGAVRARQAGPQPHRGNAGSTTTKR